MKLQSVFWMALLVSGLAGCTTYQGGTAADYDVYDERYDGASNPMSSPSMRPGLHPSDIRDPGSVNQRQVRP